MNEEQRKEAISDLDSLHECLRSALCALKMRGDKDYAIDRLNESLLALDIFRVVHLTPEKKRKTKI